MSKIGFPQIVMADVTFLRREFWSGNMRCVLSLLAIVVCGTGVALAADLPAIDKWVNFEAPDKSFKAIFPTDPKQSEQPAGALKIAMYTFEMGDTGALLIATNPLSKVDTTDAKLVKSILDGGVKGANNNLKGKISKETDINWQDKFPGRDVEIAAKLGELDVIVRVKMILANDKLYQVMAAGVKESISKPEVDKFLGSLEIQ
jgi:hypothetical protein